MIIIFLGGWANHPGGPYAWGYCFIIEKHKQTYCTPKDSQCPLGKNIMTEDLSNSHSKSLKLYYNVLELYLFFEFNNI